MNRTPSCNDATENYYQSVVFHSIIEIKTRGQVGFGTYEGRMVKNVGACLPEENINCVRRPFMFFFHTRATSVVLKCAMTTQILNRWAGFQVLKTCFSRTRTQTPRNPSVFQLSKREKNFSHRTDEDTEAVSCSRVTGPRQFESKRVSYNNVINVIEIDRWTWELRCGSRWILKWTMAGSWVWKRKDNRLAKELMRISIKECLIRY